MSTDGLVKFFMARRKCDLKKAQWLADQVVIRRKLKADSAPKLEKAQLTLGIEADMGAEEPTHNHEPDDPTVNF